MPSCPPLCHGQVQFSLVSTLPLKSGLVEAAKELDVRLVAYSPLGLGLLTGRYSEDRLPQVRASRSAMPCMP